jgi:ribonuclease Y
MPTSLVLIFIILSLVVGGGLGYLFRWLLSLGRLNSLELEIKNKLVDARESAERTVREARESADKILSEVREYKLKIEEEISARLERTQKREEFLDNRQVELETKTEEAIRARERAEKRSQVAEKYAQELQEKLARASSLSKEEAKKELIEHLEREYDEDVRVRVQKLELQAKERVEKEARKILASTIQRLGNSVPAEIMSTTVSLPSDESKGKIIGKEGRNIKAFERRSGVELIVDDNPGVITISSFSPLRRQIARVALENLIEDGRIQPARIEEALSDAERVMEEIVKKKGEEAAFECGIYTLDPQLLSLLGQLHLRTSYGQNVLSHSIEVSHIAGLLAEELGANTRVAKAGGLLHDIGKALDHDAAGSHVEIGIRILRKHGVEEDIITAMKSHHNEYPFESLEAVLVQVGDALSGGRPGVRTDSIEAYLDRLQDLEAIALRIPGVDKSYAIQGGRELRVFVRPEEVSDLQARSIARDIAKAIEDELHYPGEIRVYVIRESRIIEYAR